MDWTDLYGSFKSTWKVTIPCFAAAYLLLVRALRYERARRVERGYGYAGSSSLESMTVNQAYEIQKSVMQLEFPWMTTRALEFALFKTYGIPTISGLLAKTTEFSSKKTAGKRAVDTEILIVEFIRSPPTSDRACAAISRMNYIHSHYQKAGKISNDDLLYTLALFVLEPARWIKNYEWRELTAVELCAFGVFWKAVGDAMNISYTCLPSFKTSWRNGTEWLSELESWAEDYEARHMVYADSNRKVANETTKILAYGAPESWMPFARQVTATLMSKRLRDSMKYTTTDRLTMTVHSILKLRAAFLRHLALPRIFPFRSLSDKPDPKTGKYYRTAYEGEPWYVPDTTKFTWTPQALFRRLIGSAVPGEKFLSHGYEIHEVGPFSMKSKGMEEYNTSTESLMASQRGGCPFSRL